MKLLKFDKVLYIAVITIFCISCYKSRKVDTIKDCNKIKIEYSFYSSLDEELINYQATLTYRCDPLLKYNLVVNDSLLFYKNEAKSGFLNFRTNALENKIETNEIGVPTGNFVEDLFPEFIFNKNYLINFLSDTINKKIEVKKIGYVSLIQKETIQAAENNKELVKFIGSQEYLCYNNVTDEIFFEITVANFDLNDMKFFQKEFKKFRYLNSELCNLDYYKDRILEAKNADIPKHIEAKNVSPSKIPEFKFRDLNDQIMESKAIVEDFVFMEFWYISCAPCLKNMKSINSIYSRYKSKNIKFLVLNDTDFEIDKIKNIKNKFNLTYDLFYHGDSISRIFEIDEHPFTMIYDNRNKVIIHRKTGINSSYEQEINHILDSLITK